MLFACFALQGCGVKGNLQLPTQQNDQEKTTGKPERTQGKPERTQGEPETATGEPETTAGKPEKSVNTEQ